MHGASIPLRRRLSYCRSPRAAIPATGVPARHIPAVAVQGRTEGAGRARPAVAEAGHTDRTASRVRTLAFKEADVAE